MTTTINFTNHCFTHLVLFFSPSNFSRLIILLIKTVANTASNSSSSSWIDHLVCTIITRRLWRSAPETAHMCQWLLIPAIGTEISYMYHNSVQETGTGKWLVCHRLESLTHCHRRRHWGRWGGSIPPTFIPVLLVLLFLGGISPASKNFFRLDALAMNIPPLANLSRHPCSLHIGEEQSF